MALIKIIGNTYNCKDLIKGRGGKWDGASKSWTIDAAAWAILSKLDNGRATYGCRVAGVAAPVATQTAYKPVANTNQPCRKCGSYCFGDCAE